MSAIPTTLSIAQLSTEQKLKTVVERAAKLLPGDVGNQLLELVSPAALATMAVVVGIWAGSHFFGVGEIADIVLLVVGYAALGGVAFEGAKEVMAFIHGTLDAKADPDLDEAAEHLAKAVSLLGVQLVLAVLLKKRPTNTFKNTFKNSKIPAYSEAFSKPLPRNTPFRYTPQTIEDSELLVGRGGTKPYGDVRIGTKPQVGMTAQAAKLAEMEARYHEAVHQALAPKVYLLRELRIYIAQAGYRRSYVLRYLEEALAETFAQVRIQGITSTALRQGLRFPLKSMHGNYYEITIAQLGTEARGILLGPIVVGGMTYNVYCGAGSE